MSSTHRGATRLPDDHYKTPAWATRAILSALPLEPKRILEPTAGAGAMVRELRVWAPLAEIVAVELDVIRCARLVDAGADTAMGKDFLSIPIPPEPGFDLAITNPPFSLAMRIIERSMRFAPNVVMLLRLNFLGSLERAAFLRETRPDVYVLPKRPSFAASLKCKPKDKSSRGCGWAVVQPLEDPRPKGCPACSGPVTVTTSDSCEYAWLHWHPGRTGRWSVLEIREAA